MFELGSFIAGLFAGITLAGIIAIGWREFTKSRDHNREIERREMAVKEKAVGSGYDSYEDPETGLQILRSPHDKDDADASDAEQS